jgi:hypothetical protein
MTSRTEFAPSHLIRWLVAPSAMAALLAALTALLRRRAENYRPSVPPMSDEWLRNHTATGRDYWR